MDNKGIKITTEEGKAMLEALDFYIKSTKDTKEQEEGKKLYNKILKTINE